MTRFSTDQLSTFAAVIEYGTFDAAADVLRVSPSAAPSTRRQISCE